jgi:hypothetical protein|tara:strand:- start:667 stop:1266 length:600 start_codon:yes stop_codon:yes gene_type:complete
MNKYLIREYFELCPNGQCEDLLTETEKRKIKQEGAVYLTGIIQSADNLNGNGRIYPRATLAREIESYKRLCKERRSVGELDHPDDSVVNLKNVSHVVLDVWWNSNDVMGKIEVLNTPSGEILKSLIGSGIKLGISSRGLGSVRKESGRTMVEDDFQLICFDIVQEPSTKKAFLNLSESKVPNVFNKNDRINRALNDILL